MGTQPSQIDIFWVAGFRVRVATLPLATGRKFKHCHGALV
jgi:hypothetical protein